MTTNTHNLSKAQRGIYSARFEPITLNHKAGRSSQLKKAKEQNASVRAGLEKWIEENKMSEHLKLLPAGHVFNMLFIEADSEGKQQLPKAPFLTNVELCEKLDVDLLTNE